MEDGTAIGMGLATAVNKIESEAKSKVIDTINGWGNNQVLLPQ